MRALVASALLVAACTRVDDTGAPPPHGPNILLVVLDDVGTGDLATYGEPHAPPTPHLDALAAEGLRFERFYADPLCSPTRAGLLTGRHGFRYGIGSYLGVAQRWHLPEREHALPEALWSYDSAAVGKLHLGGRRDRRPEQPMAHELGFDRYEGAPTNLNGILADGQTEDYFHYDRIGDDGSWHLVTGYDTADVTDSALRALETLTEPWLLHVGYHAAHHPFHAPPDGWNPLGAQPDDPLPVLQDAMVASVDAEVGRLLAALDEDLRARTLVLVVSDNGPSPDALEPPDAGRPAKGSLYELGVRVPLIAAGGPVTARGSTDALVSHVDVFCTLLELASAPPPNRPLDCVSFLPLLTGEASEVRDHVYAEVFEPNGEGPPTLRDARMVRDPRYKLMRDAGLPDRLYDLVADPREEDDLLAGALSSEARAAHERLAALLGAYEDAGEP